MVEVKLHFGKSLLFNFFHLLVFQRTKCIPFNIFCDSKLFNLFINIILSQEMDDFWIILFSVINEKTPDLVTL
jgi:hypothetical protein